MFSKLFSKNLSSDTVLVVELSNYNKIFLWYLHTGYCFNKRLAHVDRHGGLGDYAQCTHDYIPSAIGKISLTACIINTTKPADSRKVDHAGAIDSSSTQWLTRVFFSWRYVFKLLIAMSIEIKDGLDHSCYTQRSWVRSWIKLKLIFSSL